MIQEIGNIFIRDVVFGQETQITNHTLTIEKKAMQSFLMRDKKIKDVKIHLAKPGESTRIICVKDVLEPRIKVSQAPVERIHTLKNIAVVTCGQIVAYQEGIIDMSGTGSKYSPFSQTLNVVLEIDVVSNLSSHEHEETLRCAGLCAAEFLSQTINDAKPDELETLDLNHEVIDENLSRVVYICMLLSQGLMHDNYVFKRNAKEGLPVFIQKSLNNDIISGNCVSACDKNTTWHHQNNPVIRALLKKHGKELNFVGVILTNEPTTLSQKETSAKKAVALTREHKADGAIITEEGFGNPEADLMMLIRGLEQAGIKTVCITDEFAGSDGESQSLADTTPEANAVVSVGNANELIELSPMERTIGPINDLTKLAGAYPQSLRKDGSLEIEIQGIVGATNQLGEQTLSCKEV